MIRIYYFVTPIFVLLDLVLGWSIRVAGLSSTGARLWYYAFCLGCAAVVYLRPKLQPLVGITESSINFGILIVSFYTSMVLFGDSQAGPPLTIGRLVNFILTGSVLIYSFNVSMLKLSGHRPD